MRPPTGYNPCLDARARVTSARSSSTDDRRSTASGPNESMVMEDSTVAFRLALRGRNGNRGVVCTHDSAGKQKSTSVEIRSADDDFRISILAFRVYQAINHSPRCCRVNPRIHGGPGRRHRSVARRHDFMSDRETFAFEFRPGNCVRPPRSGGLQFGGFLRQASPPPSAARGRTLPRTAGSKCVPEPDLQFGEGQLRRAFRGGTGGPTSSRRTRPQPQRCSR